jgi:hypothetical protein
MPLDGDMSEVILPTPTKGYYKVLHDPFGLGVLLRGEVYANPNRFFAHWTTSTYFKGMPLLLQRFIDPIDSVYLSAAIAKTLIQILILYLLAVFISNTGNILKGDFLIASFLIAPLFQTSGFNRFIGIIDPSVIYTFFYALPLGLTLLFFLPFFNVVFYNKAFKPSLFKYISLALFIVFISLNGPLVPGVILIACPMVISIIWVRNFKKEGTSPIPKRLVHSWKEIPRFVLYYFIAACVLGLYSLYIGRSNALNYSGTIPLMERYLNLPMGLFNLVTQKLGYVLLLIMTIVNVVLVNRNKSDEAFKLLGFVKWIGVFATLYVLLLPLGGYRAYRPNVIRYDTIMPITIALIFVFGATSFYLVKSINRRYKTVYFLGLGLFLFIFTNADRLQTREYECERQAFETIASSSENIVELDCDCPVMEWEKVYDYNLSGLNAELFYYWNITDEKKLYYHNSTNKE